MKLFKISYSKNSTYKTSFIFAKNLFDANTKAQNICIKKQCALKSISAFSSQFINEDEELEMLFWQLGFFYESGINLYTSIESIKQNIKSKNILMLLDDMQISLQKGRGISNALKKHTKLCGNFAYLLFEIGEMTSRMNEICNICSKDMKNKYDFKNSLKKALTYPAIILFSIISVFIIISIFVMPEFSSIYNDLEANLPFATKLLIFISNAIINYYYILLPVCIIIFVIFSAFFANKKRRDFFMIKMPMLKDIIIYYELYRYFLGLSIFIKSQIPFLKSIETCINLINNAALSKDFHEILKYIQQGNALSLALSKINIDIANLSLIKSAELSGNLDTALEIIAQYYKRKYDNMLEKIQTLAQPIAIIIMGFIIAIICLGVLMPIWNLVDVLE